MKRISSAGAEPQPNGVCEGPAPGPAHWDVRAIRQDDVGTSISANRGDASKVDDGPAMDPNKEGGIEALLE